MNPLTCGTDMDDRWATVIGTAMHFNDMLLSTRSLVASVMLALIGAAALSVVQLDGRKSFIGPFHVGILVLAGGFIFLFSVFALDYLYYFRLLLGSVEIAESLERQCSALPQLTIKLSETVSRTRAYLAVTLFYSVIALVMIALAVIIWKTKRRSQ